VRTCTYICYHISVVYIYICRGLVGWGRCFFRYVLVILPYQASRGCVWLKSTQKSSPAKSCGVPRIDDEIAGCDFCSPGNKKTL
ncbi:hypothetical protein CSUI_004199, partial [Cystoisospora suis]